MAVTIFDNKFRDNLQWLDIKTSSAYHYITSYYLIDDKLVIGMSNTLKSKTFGITENSGRVKYGLSRYILNYC